MATEFEIAAGLVRSWAERFGNPDVTMVTDDLIEILHICHEMAETNFDIHVLATRIAEYLMEAFSTPMQFNDRMQGDPMEHADSARNVDGIQTESIPNS